MGAPDEGQPSEMSDSSGKPLVVVNRPLKGIYEGMIVVVLK
jgi:hypothetical protein